MSSRLYGSLYPSTIKLDGGAMFGIIPKPLWSKKIAPDELNRIPMTMRVFIIKEKNKLILIDSGAGDYQGEKFNDRYGLNRTPMSFKELLHKMLGCTPDDVTDLVLSHLHFDHASGSLTGENLAPSFPRAKLHVHRKHYEYSLRPTLRDAGSFQDHVIKKILSYYEEKKQIHWLDGLEGTIIEDLSDPLKYKTCHGHTPFQILPYDSKTIFLADLVPTHAHFHIPWVMGYDLHPGVSATERFELYPWIHKNNLWCIFDHDLHYWGAKITSSKDQQLEISNCQQISHDLFEWHKNIQS
jgi:glyoxylase-like metal-dependent hydrolase (beta-lactamase superfamily II)